MNTPENETDSETVNGRMQRLVSSNMTMPPLTDKWRNELSKACRSLQTMGDYPVWWDGFSNVIMRGETSHDDDNTYGVREQPEHDEYKRGAIAAESLLANKTISSANK